MTPDWNYYPANLLPYNKRKVHGCMSVRGRGFLWVFVCVCCLAFLQRHEIVEKQHLESELFWRVFKAREVSKEKTQNLYTLHKNLSLSFQEAVKY